MFCRGTGLLRRCRMKQDWENNSVITEIKSSTDEGSKDCFGYHRIRRREEDKAASQILVRHAYCELKMHQRVPTNVLLIKITLRFLKRSTARGKVGELIAPESKNRN